MSTATKSAGIGKRLLAYTTPEFIYGTDPDGHPWIPAARVSCTSSRDFARATLSLYKQEYPQIFYEIEYGFQSGERLRASTNIIPLIEQGLLVPTSTDRTQFELHPAVFDIFLDRNADTFEPIFKAQKIPGLRPPSKLTLVQPDEELNTGMTVPFAEIKTPQQKRAAVLDNFDYCEYRLKVMQEFQGELYASLKLYCNSPTSISFGETKRLIEEGFIDSKSKTVPLHIKLRMETGNPISRTSIPDNETSVLFGRDLTKSPRNRSIVKKTPQKTGM